MRAMKTVFVVGAGASKEVGLPVGSELVEIVADKLNYQMRYGSLDPDHGDRDVLDAIQQVARDRPALDSYLAAARRVREGVIYSNSIDTFLDLHKDDQKITELGKLAIAKTILEREQSSSLYIEHNGTEFPDVAGLKDTWLVGLIRGMSAGVPREEIDRIFERVSFIVFNYDRCIEHFLHNALRKLYGIDDTEAGSVLKNLPILHPYGVIANLPWRSADGIPFGFPANRAAMRLMSKKIKTYTEQIEDRTTLDAVKQEVETADILVFLGFSYHQSNLAILDPGAEIAAKKVLGTALKISESDVGEIRGRLQLLARRDLTDQVLTPFGSSHATALIDQLHIRRDLTCAALIEQYSRTLFTTDRRGDS